MLPHLKTQQPKQLIEALRQGFDTLDGTPEKEREKSLGVSLDYSFAKLSERARRHLPFLAFFSERVDADRLNSFLNTPDDPLGFKQAYQTLFGKSLQNGDWSKILNEATEAGILEHLGESIYKIHPALPWYLRQQLSKQHAAQEVSELEKKLLILYMFVATANDPEENGNAQWAIKLLLFEEPNLLRNLRLAEQQQEWYPALKILRALGQVYNLLGCWPEFRSLRQRLISQVGANLAEAKVKGLRKNLLQPSSPNL